LRVGARNDEQEDSINLFPFFIPQSIHWHWFVAHKLLFNYEKGGQKMSYTEIELKDIKQGIKMLILNRPEKMNAITSVMVDELLQALSELHRDRNCRVLILTGAGKGFCAGLDREEIEKCKDVEAIWFLAKYATDVIQAMRGIPQPIICAMNGAAAGGGASLAMACDIRIAIPKTKFILAYINIGMTAGDMGSSYFLPRLIGMSRASDIMLTGRPVPADEAERIGLVSKIAEPEALISTAVEYAENMLGKSDFGLRLTKEMINSGMDSGSLSNQVLVENRSQSLCAATNSFGGQ